MNCLTPKQSHRRLTCFPVNQTDPPQSWVIEWDEIDIEAEMRQQKRLRVAAVALSLIGIISSLTALTTVALRCLVS